MSNLLITIKYQGARPVAILKKYGKSSPRHRRKFAGKQKFLPARATVDRALTGIAMTLKLSDIINTMSGVPVGTPLIKDSLEVSQIVTA